METAKFLALMPVLPSQDVAAAIDFYVNKLAFQLQFQDSLSNPFYAGVSRDGVQLHLQWHDPSEWSTVERPQLRFEVPEIELLFEEYQGLSVFHANTKLRTTPWGTREFAFFDLDQNGLTFFARTEVTGNA
ncbi:MAG: glyoxalase/bleomycin resistance/extradiol dioxygenase family protein [Planctomycetota bacterium]|nr:MAG: glyoxalase/bleomycin resistance/extradiol dioxygenase family protein [Planctomycetota bacterium]